MVRESKEYLFVEIDMRNDFADDPRAALPVPGAYAIVGKMAVLEYNAAGVVVFYDLHREDDPISQEEFKTFPPHCVPGTWGHERMCGLEEVDDLMPKNSYDSWKGMMDKDGYTPEYYVKCLEMSLRYYNTVVVGGVVTGICVKAFVEGAIERGFATGDRELIVVSDCVANLEGVEGVPTTEELFKAWSEAGVRIMTFEEFIKEFSLDYYATYGSCQ